MEITLLDGEIYELEEVKQETINSMKNVLEWHYEETGEYIGIDEAVDEVDLKMEKEKWIYDACDTFWDDIEKVYNDFIDDVDDNKRYWKDHNKYC